MRWLWLIALLLVAAAVAAALWPSPAAQVPVLRAAGAVGTPDMAAPVQPAVTAPARTHAAAPVPARAEPAFAGAATDTPPTAAPAPPPAAAGDGTITVTPGPAATVERVDAQTVRLDGRYTVRGTGSESDPYRVSWELLGSVQGGMDLAAQVLQLPGRVGTMQDAWVQISGYWAPPLQRFETREIMVMLNKWDGCCIGTPPTPFDSIEVTLATELRLQGQHAFRYGTVRGRLRVSPFAVGPFLLGLYQLEDAVLETS